MIADIALEFCARGGKRLRPRLCKAAFEAASGVPASGDGIRALCEAVECFHKASLIHDDIQDCDEERYGRPTVWKEHGVALAIAAGDWLVAHGYGLIAGSGFPNALEMMKETLRSHIALCEGQGEDLSPGSPKDDDARYASICEKKTGEAFALAAALGAMAAGCDPEPYRRYGLAFGKLFQLRDDISDGEAPGSAKALEPEFVKGLEECEVAERLGRWHEAHIHTS